MPLKSSSEKTGKKRDSLRVRFQEMDTSEKKKPETSTSEKKKPDFKEFSKGSPVSPLGTQRLGVGGGRGGGGGTAAASGMTGTSSSSNSSGSFSAKTGTNTAVGKRSGGTHSGELSGSSEWSPTSSGNRNKGPGPTGNVRSPSRSVPLIYTGGSSANSPQPVKLPAGNIFPSGKILKSGESFTKTPVRRDVLGSGGTGHYGHGTVMRGNVLGSGGTGHYGHGTVMRGNVMGKSDEDSGTSSIGSDSSELSKIRRVLNSSDPEEVTKAGNEQYKGGHFTEALALYNRAIKLSPGSVVCYSNKAAALTGLGRLTEAVMECEEALRFDPGYEKAHKRLVNLHLRLGQVENARKHLCQSGEQSDPDDLQKLQTIERHLRKCASARRNGDWKSALRESDAAISAGAESSPQLFACRTEALLKLHQLEAVDTSLAAIPKFELYPHSCSQTRFFGILSESYVFFVKAQVEMAFGRSENAIAAAEKAAQIDPSNVELVVMLNNIKSVARARSLGNELFISGKFVEACSAYRDGLKVDSSNAVLYFNRATCWSKLEEWEKALDDCNQALRIKPDYTKALLRRAVCNSKLERWVESIGDYEVLKKKHPEDCEIAEGLFRAQVALKKSRGEDVQNMKFGGEVEVILDLDKFRSVLSSQSVSIVLFKAASEQESNQISPIVNALCTRYPALNFLKVDVIDSPAIMKAEKISVVPTVNIYKKGKRVKEMICPSRHILESSVLHYSL